jgi:membrane protease YdiL (CAAX protease family)
VWLIGIGVLLFGLSAGALTFGGTAGGFRLENLLRPQDVAPAFLPLYLTDVLGVILGVVGLIAYIVRGSTSPVRAREGYGTIGTVLACLAVAALVSVVLTIPFAASQPQSSAGGALTPGLLVLSVVTLDGALVTVVYLRIVRPGVLSWRQLGLTTSDASERFIQGVGVGVFVIAGDAVIEGALRLVGVHQTQSQEFAGIQGASVAQFVGVLIAAAVIAPICEEIFFRGYAFSAMRKTYGIAVAAAISSVLFAVAHFNVQAFAPLVFVGVSFAVVKWRTSSLVPSMIAHGMNNALALTALYLSSR